MHLYFPCTPLTSPLQKHLKILFSGMWHCADRGIRFYGHVGKILSRYRVHIQENNIGHCPAMTTQWITTANNLVIFETLGTSAVNEFAQHLCSVMDSWWIINELDRLCARRLLKANSHITCVSMPRPCRAMPWPWEIAFRTAWSEHGRGATWARHGMCEWNTAALCKSNGKDTI